MYRLYGMAAHHCCNIEYRLARLLLGAGWSSLEDPDSEKIEAVYDDLSSLTLGQLLKKYKDHREITDEQSAVIDEIQTKRNYLAHRFFGMYGKRMKESDVVEEMIAELKDLITFFQAVSHSLDIE